MSHKENISLEETNKHRIALGLKPLTDDKVPADSVERRAEDHYTEQCEKEAQDGERKMIQNEFAEQELNTRLKLATLSDIDPNNTKALLGGTKKEWKLPAKRSVEIGNMDDASQGEYNERDSKGPKVGHDFTEMGEGEARILKDGRIIDNEEDEHQNVEMAEEDRQKENQELNIKHHDYTVYDGCVQDGTSMPPPPPPDNTARLVRIDTFAAALARLNINIPIEDLIKAIRDEEGAKRAKLAATVASPADLLEQNRRRRRRLIELTKEAFPDGKVPDPFTLT